MIAAVPDSRNTSFFCYNCIKPSENYTKLMFPNLV